MGSVISMSQCKYCKHVFGVLVDRQKCGLEWYKYIRVNKQNDMYERAKKAVEVHDGLTCEEYVEDSRGPM